MQKKGSPFKTDLRHLNQLSGTLWEDTTTHYSQDVSPNGKPSIPYIVHYFSSDPYRLKEVHYKGDMVLFGMQTET